MKIVIVDDHPLVRQGLTAVISVAGDMELIGEASNAEEALNLIVSTKPDVALVDLRLTDATGLAIIETCKERLPQCKYIILTSSPDPEDFRRAGELGVDGYVLKEAFPEELVSAIRLVYRGRKYYDPGMIDSIMHKEQDDPHLQQLTSRERDVLEALGKGLSNREIAKKLFITEYTVKKHVSQILSKLELSDRTQAALYIQHKTIKLAI